jgi:hypothetical protein
MAGFTQTPAEESAINELLRVFDSAAVKLWKLGVDPVFRATMIREGAEIDGVARGSALQLKEHGDG